MTVQKQHHGGGGGASSYSHSDFKGGREENVLNSKDWGGLWREAGCVRHSQCADSYSGFCTRHGTFIKGTTQTPLDKWETYSSRDCQLAEGDTENLLFLVSHPGMTGGQEAIWLEHAVNKTPRFKALCDL